MLTIIHEEHAIEVTATGEDGYYTVGWREPHYPVPAQIMYEVDFETWYILER